MDWGAILNGTAGWIFSPTTLAYALAATGLAVHFGFAGLLNFGMAGFMALGAYGYAMSILIFGWPWWVGILVGIIASAIFAVILGIPTLRLRADYLAIVTIAAAEIVRLLFQTNTFGKHTGAARGLAGYHNSFRAANPFPEGNYGFGPWSYNETQLWVRVFGVILLLLCIFVVWALMRSPWGRVLKGIREDEDAVRSLGKNVFAYKMQALIIGGAMGALAGVVLALPSAVVPASYTPPLTFFIWTILLLGGAATVFGPAVGALIFWTLMAFLDLVLPAMAKAGYLPMTGIQAGQIRYILLGLALMALVIYRPQGIFGNKEEMTFVR